MSESYRRETRVNIKTVAKRATKFDSSIADVVGVDPQFISKKSPYFRHKKLLSPLLQLIQKIMLYHGWASCRAGKASLVRNMYIYLKVKLHESKAPTHHLTFTGISR